MRLAVLLTDAEIDALVRDPKPLPLGFRNRLLLRQKRGHQEAELEVAARSGAVFRVFLRRSSRNALDFSVILAYLVPGSTQVIRLRRYNGKSHEHSNPFEKQRFYDFHIHYATERYQRSGNKEDTYAEPSDRYATLEQAVDCLLSDCGFVVPDEPQGELFVPMGDY
jgi:hypothetical protein